jgi:thioredoxin 2
MAAVKLFRCSACGAKNRVPKEKLDEGRVAVCGRCKRPLSIPITVTDNTFTAEVERSLLPVLLDLWAPWCGPCRLVAPVIDELAAEMAGRVRFAKLNIDENPVTANRLHVGSIPTLLILNEGHEVDRIVGAQPKSEITRRLQRALLSGN